MWTKSGNVVTLCGHYSTTSAETVSLGQLPIACRPAAYCAAPTVGVSGSWIEVDANGVVRLMAKASGNNYYSIAFSV